MPDARGNIKGIAISGKAAEQWEKIFGPRPLPGKPKPDKTKGPR